MIVLCLYDVPHVLARFRKLQTFSILNLFVCWRIICCSEEFGGTLERYGMKENRPLDIRFAELGAVQEYSKLGRPCEAKTPYSCLRTLPF